MYFQSFIVLLDKLVSNFVLLGIAASKNIFGLGQLDVFEQFLSKLFQDYCFGDEVKFIDGSFWVFFELLKVANVLVGVVSPKGVGVGEEGEADFADIEALNEEVEHWLCYFAYLGIESQLHCL